MRQVTRFLPIIGLLALAGCTEVAAVAPEQAGSCGAAAYADRVGTPISSFNVKAVRAPVRVLGPDTIMTMDFRGERMNVEHSAAGTITRIYCG